MTTRTNGAGTSEECRLSAAATTSSPAWRSTASPRSSLRSHPPGRRPKETLLISATRRTVSSSRSPACTSSLLAPSPSAACRTSPSRTSSAGSRSAQTSPRFMGSSTEKSSWSQAAAGASALSFAARSRPTSRSS